MRQRDIPWSIWGHSPECLVTFPEMFGDILRNVLRHSPEYLATFPRMFCDIPRNVWGHSPEYLATFPRMFEEIPRNVWRHSPEYKIPPHSPRSTHSVPRSCIPVFIHSPYSGSYAKVWYLLQTETVETFIKQKLDFSVFFWKHASGLKESLS